VRGYEEKRAKEFGLADQDRNRQTPWVFVFIPFSFGTCSSSSSLPTPKAQSNHAAIGAVLHPCRPGIYTVMRLYRRPQDVCIADPRTIRNNDRGRSSQLHTAARTSLHQASQAQASLRVSAGAATFLAAYLQFSSVGTDRRGCWERNAGPIAWLMLIYMCNVCIIIRAQIL